MKPQRLTMRCLMKNMKRMCNNTNPFASTSATSREAFDTHALAWHVRGKRIMQQVPCKKNMGKHPALLQRLCAGTSIALVVCFLGYQVWRVVAPPRLSIESPSDGSTASSQQIIVAGATDPHATVEINGQVVFGNSNGSFSTPLELQQGANHIIIRATKRHGLFTTISRTVMLNPPTEPSPVSVSPAATALVGTVN